MNRRDFVKISGMAAAGLAAGAGGTGNLRDDLLGQAREVFAMNLVRSERGDFHVPSATRYPRFYAWDSGWNLIGLSSIDPEAALQELAGVFSFQREDGMVPHEAVLPDLAPRDESLGDVYFDQEDRCRIIDPPSYIIAAEVLYQKTEDPRVLALLPAMQKCLDYLRRERDLLGDGLVSIIHPWESGTDQAPVYDQALGLNPLDPLASHRSFKRGRAILQNNYALDWDMARIGAADMFVFEDLCLNGITAAAALAIANLYEANHQPEQSAAARQTALNMARAMEKFCWNEEHGFFYPRWSVKRREQQLRTCASGFLPLLTGLIDPAKARRLFDEHLLDPARFNTPYVVPFNSEEELKREFNPIFQHNLWRGRCVWANMSWMLARAASRYGRDDISRDLTRRNAEMIRRAGFREWYHPRTGRGMGAKGFTWPALILDMIDQYGL